MRVSEIQKDVLLKMFKFEAPAKCARFSNKVYVRGSEVCTAASMLALARKSLVEEKIDRSSGSKSWVLTCRGSDFCKELEKEALS